jgi:hypothetical protein
MKWKQYKFILGFAFLFVLLLGCASLKPERKVVDNVFYSSYPKVEMRVNPELIYLGELKYHSTKESVSGGKLLSYNHECFIFLQADSKKTAKRLFIIRTQRVETYFVSDLFGRVKNKLDFGTSDIDGHDYQYYIGAIEPKASGEVTKYISDNGYVVPRCALLRRDARVFGSKENLLFSVEYMEDISKFKYECKSWKLRDELTEEQELILKRFNSNHLASLSNNRLVSLGEKVTVEHQSFEPASRTEAPIPRQRSVGTPKPKLAVMDLKAKYGVERGLAEGLSEIIRDSIHGLGDYEVLSKDDVEVIAKRTAIRQSLGCDDTKCLIAIGKSLGSKFMVAGSISKFGDTYNISLRLIETTGKNPGVRKRIGKRCKCAEDELIGTSATVAASLMGQTETQTARPMGETKTQSSSMKSYSKLSLKKEPLTESPIVKPHAKLPLRKEPKKMLGEDAVRTMLKNYNFFDSVWNWNGSFANDFVDNGDGTVTDRATGLMWQKDGSPKPLTLKEAISYIRSLSNKRFMGYSDWRIPTVEELASLIGENAKRGLYIDPLFATKQKSCWSSDSGFVEDKYMKDVWIADFVKGRLVLYMLEDRLYLIGDYRETYYVRGVRSTR